MTADLRAQTLTRAVVQLTTGGESSDWRTEAACAEYWITDTWDPWFPESTKGHLSTYDIARAICAKCPVAQACLKDAMETEETVVRHGMRGGLTPAERSGRHPSRTEPPGLACGDRRGTGTGYERHRRVGEPACQACKTAASEIRATRVRAKAKLAASQVGELERPNTHSRKARA